MRSFWSRLRLRLPPYITKRGTADVSSASRRTRVFWSEERGSAFVKCGGCMATTFRGCVVHIPYKRSAFGCVTRPLSLSRWRGKTYRVVFTLYAWELLHQSSCFARKIDSNEICFRVRFLLGGSSYTFSRHIYRLSKEPGRAPM
jgi:hypothetical protein